MLALLRYVLVLYTTAEGAHKETDPCVNWGPHLLCRTRIDNGELAFLYVCFSNTKFSLRPILVQLDLQSVKKVLFSTFA